MTRTLMTAFAATFLQSALAYAAPPASASAPPGGRDPTVDARSGQGPSGGFRHEGFVLRMSGGIAVMGLGVEPEQSAEVGVGATGHTVNVMIGGYVTRNLALHADFIGVESGYARADVEGDGESSVVAEEFTMGAGGIGMTYFVMPYNLGLTGSLMLARVSAETRFGQSYTTDYALIGKFGVTKEWAVSQDWALGVGATALLGYGQGDDATGEDFQAGVAGLSLNFVASYD
jgi:hypothetical protein